MDETSGPQPEGRLSALSAPATSKLATDFGLYEPVSRAASPGGSYSKTDEDDKRRYRPRTYAYFRQLPFEVEEQSDRDAALQAILKQLYIAIEAEDFTPGALHWTRELEIWINLKFEMPRELRAKLVQVYYSLTLSPGIDSTVADRFQRMVVTLTRKDHYLKPGEDLTLDWRPIWNDVKAAVLPTTHHTGRKRITKMILKLANHTHTYFDPSDRPQMLEEFLPFFSVNDLPNAYIVAGAISTLLPSHPAPASDTKAQPEAFFPTLFHIWSIINRSKVIDVFFLDLLSRFARDHLSCDHIEFGPYGMLTKAQADVVFTTVLRLTQIPVGQSTSSHSTLDMLSGSGILLTKDEKKHPVAYMVARLIVNSLSPKAAENNESMLSNLEGLLESVDTFFHPSNQGSWTTFLAQLTLFLTDAFASRWNREQSGELVVPEDRKITPELKKRFVLALREVTFMGLFSKSSRVSKFYYIALQGLAYLEPDLVLPGALQRFYPSLQGLVEVHRTTSSLIGLQMIVNTMSKLKGYRCHLTALLALTLPGIDANDLNKTQYTLYLIQSIAFSIPIANLANDDGDVHDTMLAMEWVQGEMDRMETEGQNVTMNYSKELSDEDEERILRSSTAGFGEFILTLLGKVFTLLENLPEGGGAPEDDVVSALSAAMSPLFATMSPEIYDMALDKIASFVSGHVVHQARDAMARILNALVKVNPEKALKVFVPMFVVNIRNEIDDNEAASDRTTGTDYLPRDRALVWHLSMLAMTVVHVGGEVLKYKDELLSLTHYMQEKVRGLPTLLVSNFIHHLLLNLTHTYPIDHSLYEPEVLERGINASDWGRETSASELTIRWHHPSQAEIKFAVELFASQTQSATEQLDLLLSDNPPVPRTGKNKEWSDEVSRLMEQIWLVTSGMAVMFDPKKASDGVTSKTERNDFLDADGDELMGDDHLLSEVADDETLRPQFHWKAGYLLTEDDPIYKRIHDLRKELGNLLSKAHSFLIKHQEDDVKSFTALYSAYRTWITDVGFERSAHALERHTNLYKSYVSAFKIKGLRKVYPRPLLIKRAESYLLLRLKRNAASRHKSELDTRLLLDLADSCLSSYADIRRAAQSAQDSSLRSLIGGKSVVIPPILDAMRKAIKDVDHDRIKGGIYSLLFTSLLKTIIRDWRFAPQAMRIYIEVAGIDKPSIEKLSSSAVLSLYDFGKPSDRMVVTDKSIVASIKPDDDTETAIEKRHKFILKRRSKVEAEKASLGLELVEKARGTHWKVATRCALFAANLCLRFNTIAPAEFVDLVTEGANDPHPGLRSSFFNALLSLFSSIDTRAIFGHEYRNYLLDNDIGDKNRLTITVEKGDAGFTKKFLDAFEDNDGAGYMVDADHPGWLVWGKDFGAYRAKPLPFDNYDDLERGTRERIGQMLNKDWMKRCLDHFKQEPRDQYADRFNMGHVYMLMHVFDLMYCNQTAVTWEEVKELTTELFGDGSDKHQHRATSEVIGALLAGSSDEPQETRNQVWEFAVPLLLNVFADELTPENLSYWSACLHHIIDSRDPRRAQEIEDKLSSFRLDMTSNAAFKESSKIQLLELLIGDAGWHYRREKPILEDFLAHIDHPYKAVRESIGRVLAVIFRTRNHESFENVQALLDANKAVSSIGIRPFQATDEITATIKDVLVRLEKWRHERTPGQQTPSSYTSGSKTILMWLDSALGSYESVQLVPFFTAFMDELLHMMDVKEDPELMRLAYHVYRQFPNVPLREGEDVEFINGLVRLGRTASSWHQRLRALVNMQVIYFRRLFMTQAPERDLLFMTISDMLGDSQLEVRNSAASTLAGMIRCSPARIRDPMIERLRERFETELAQNPMPKRKPKLPGTETPVNVHQQIQRRHAAVLGLGALIEAFPYATPPPKWMPEVLAILARKAAGDAGVVGKATKSILSEFKKTRQDSWMVDQKVSGPDTCRNACIFKQE